MAPGGDFLARMFLGSELVDEVDFREKAARRARVQAGKEWRAMKAQGSAPSSSHSSSDYVSSGASSQRRDASSRRDAREVTQGHVGEPSYREVTQRDAPSRRDREATRLTAGQGERLISEQGRVACQQGRSRHESQPAGRSHGVSARDHAPVARGQAAHHGGNTYRSEMRQSHAASMRGQGGEPSYHASRIVEIEPRSNAHSDTPRDISRYPGGSRHTASQSRR